jgi:hypothetical protein
VEYPVDLAPGRNWRLTALAAAALAALELVLLVILAVVAFGIPFAEHQRAQAGAALERGPAAGPEDGRGETSVAVRPRSETSVVVLNGNGIAGAADLASVEVRNRQYVLTGTGNAPRSDVPRSLVMYRPGFEGEAQRLAKDLGVRRVAPLDGLRGSDLMGAQLALVVGRQ